VLRRRWLDDVGLEAYSRPPQISAVTWWTKNRQEAEAEGVVGPFASTPTAIRSAYDKRKSRPAKDADTTDIERITTDLEHEDIVGTRFTAEDFLQAEAQQLEREVAAMTRAAQRHGEDDIPAAQAALARAMALVRVATGAVEMAYVRAEAAEPDPESDF
jgi:hypothetical protein